MSLFSSSDPTHARMIDLNEQQQREALDTVTVRREQIICKVAALVTLFSWLFSSFAVGLFRSFLRLSRVVAACIH